jgi:hypothetical protein
MAPDWVVGIIDGEREWLRGFHRVSRGGLDFFVPLLAGLNAGVALDVDNASADERLQDGLQFLQPILVFMAVADAYLVALWPVHSRGLFSVPLCRNTSLVCFLSESVEALSLHLRRQRYLLMSFRRNPKIELS